MSTPPLTKNLTFPQAIKQAHKGSKIKRSWWKLTHLYVKDGKLYCNMSDEERTLSLCEAVAEDWQTL